MISLIRFNDDNHAERIFINGKYIGNSNDIGFVIRNALLLCKGVEQVDIKETPVYVCDDFADYDEEDTFVDDIWEFFNTVENMTEKQIEYIEQRNWKELHKEI